MKLLLVTGRRAEQAVKLAAEKLRELTGWTIDVYVAPVDVAALMPQKLLEKIVEERGHAYDAIIVSGLIGYNVDSIGAKHGVRVVKGPEDPFDLVVIAEAGVDVLEKSIVDGRFEAARAAERWLELLSRVHAEKASVEVCSVRVPLRPPPVVVAAEIYAGNSVEEVVERAESLLQRGADIVVAGFGYEHDTSKVLEVLHNLYRRVGPVAADSPNPKALAKAAREGYACLVFSADPSNGLLEMLPKGSAAVIVPAAAGSSMPQTPIERVEVLEKLAREASTRGITAIADPVIGPPLQGLADSIVALYEAGRRLNDIPLLAGIANVYELLDADTHGVIAALVPLVAEAGASIILVSEESSKAYMAVTEASIAATMTSIAMVRSSVPKDLGVDLLAVKEKRRQPEKHPTYQVERVDADAIASWHRLRLEKVEHVIHVVDNTVRDIVITRKKVFELIGSSARNVYKAIAYLGLARQADHAAYLGYELCKAELALKLGRSYRQDSDVIRPPWSGRVVYSARRMKPMILD